MAVHCGTCGEYGKEGLSLLEPENAPLLQFAIKHLQLGSAASGSFFVCQDCVVEITHGKNFFTRFQTSQTYFQHVLATSDIPQQTDVEPLLETKLAKCQVLVTKLLQCDSCSFYTNIKSQLESHMQTHLEATNTSKSRRTRNDGRRIENACSQCGTKFFYSESLAWHIQYCHGKNPIVKLIKTNRKCKYKYQCLQCKKVLDNADKIIQHLRTKHQLQNLPFCCQVCNKQFVGMCHLIRHQLSCKTKKAVIDNNIAILRTKKCVHCSVTSSHSEIIDWHTKYCHGNDAIVKVTNVAGTKGLNYQCVFCQTVFHQSYMMLAHLRDQHNVQNMPFRCNFCDKSYAWRAKLNGHKNICKYKGNTHIDENKQKNIEASHINLRCKMCSKECQSDDEMKTHVSDFHAIERYRFECRYCDQKFKLFPHLKSHFNTIHPGKYIFRCRICGAKFNLRDSYTMHKYVHKEKVLECNICHGKFSNRNSLTIHIKTMHLVSRESVSCSLCEAKFKQQQYLKYHLLYVHTGPILHCWHCPYQTRRKRCLVLHVQRHLI